MIPIKENVNLSEYSTFKIGGPAKFLAEVKNLVELRETLEFVHEKNLDFFILGGGSNILFSDEGFDGLLIKIQDIEYKIEDNKLECGAGLPLAQAVNFAKKNGLTGLEWAVGIPGTIGGAVRGNAGAFGGSMGEIVESASIMEIKKLADIEEKPEIFNQEKCQFAYRDSLFKHNPHFIILSIVLKLKKENPQLVENKMNEIARQRAERKPEGIGSAGSFFKNPFVKDQNLIKEFETEKNIKCLDGKIPAGWLIENAGFKGRKIGGAMVSENNANYIVNMGKATAHDVIMLASLIKQKVRNTFKIELQEEVQYLGFD
ncbi:MAG: UDP-N-acetylmuramate dehydrogenase [Candidatus Moranbacteria bacterium]|nr:UDP-N-acetylmuramate dehydrogenase [Candidatus Moranbacteria bacterium]